MQLGTHIVIKCIKCFPVLRARLNSFVLFRAILRASAMNWVAFVMYVGKAPVAPHAWLSPSVASGPSPGPAWPSVAGPQDLTLGVLESSKAISEERVGRPRLIFTCLEAIAATLRTSR